jgi:hypothetical protein
LFLKGDYDGFFGFAGKAMTNADGTAFMAGITAAIPEGFSSCATIVQREDVGGMVQEVTMFQLAGHRGFINLYLQSALIDGQRVILQIIFDESTSAVMESLQ